MFCVDFRRFCVARGRSQWNTNEKKASIFFTNSIPNRIQHAKKILDRVRRGMLINFSPGTALKLLQTDKYR